MARADYKPVQLAAARACGLDIASTLITNRSEDVRSFAAEVGGPIMCKPVASPVLIEGGHLKSGYTQRLGPKDLEDLRGVDTTAHLFQAWAAKQYEVRLTIVGERTLAAAIHAGSEAAHEDRRSNYASLTCATTIIPDSTV